MVPPHAATDFALQPAFKRLVYIACHQLAEDSGCLIWNPRDVRCVALPMEPGVTDEMVEGWMLELAEDGYLWRYEADGIPCAFVPGFPEWQKSLTRRNAPERVPLPEGVHFVAFETKNRLKSGDYYYPRSIAELNRRPANLSRIEASLSPSRSSNQGAARSERASGDQGAPDEALERCYWCKGAGVDSDGVVCHVCGGTRVAS